MNKEFTSRNNHSKRARIVLVDDHPMVRERLAEIINLEPDLTVCGEAESRSEALQVIADTKPDLALVDLSLKKSHGLELIKDLASRHSKTLVLVLSMHDESLYAERVIRAGARGYITKQEATRKILPAIRCVLGGEVYVSESVAEKLVTMVVDGQTVMPKAVVENLTDRELEVFNMLGRGYPTRQIAEELHLDVKTIETHRSRIKEKLGLEDANDLLQQAILWFHTGGEDQPLNR
jgi:DNA-binding NarL/FixJ family response regulator